VRDGNSLLTHHTGNRTHEVWLALREVLDSYDHQPTAIAEAWSGSDAYGDALPSSFAFPLLKAGWDAVALREAIDTVLAPGGVPVWVIDNHDTPRSASRLSLARSRALTLLMLALPGSVCLYQGQELGLPNVDLPDQALSDPVWERSGRQDRGRDGCRVPLPWSGTAAPFGFSTGPTWLPQPPEFADYTVERLAASPTSTLTMVKQWIRQRHAITGDRLQWLSQEPDRVHFRRGEVEVLVNLGDAPIAMPAGPVVASSASGMSEQLEPDTAVWVGTGQRLSPEPR
jgi:alpha-glucosidase